MYGLARDVAIILLVELLCITCVAWARYAWYASQDVGMHNTIRSPIGIGLHIGSDLGRSSKLPADARSVLAQKVQDDAVGLGRTAASSSGLVPKLYAALTFAFAGAGASYIFLSNETLTVCS